MKKGRTGDAVIAHTLTAETDRAGKGGDIGDPTAKAMAGDRMKASRLIVIVAEMSETGTGYMIGKTTANDFDLERCTRQRGTARIQDR